MKHLRKEKKSNKQNKKNNLSEGSLAPFCYQIKVMIVVFQPLKESFRKEFRCKKNELKQSATA